MTYEEKSFEALRDLKEFAKDDVGYWSHFIVFVVVAVVYAMHAIATAISSSARSS